MVSNMERGEITEETLATVKLEDPAAMLLKNRIHLLKGKIEQFNDAISKINVISFKEIYSSEKEIEKCYDQCQQLMLRIWHYNRGIANAQKQSRMDLVQNNTNYEHQLFEDKIILAEMQKQNHSLKETLKLCSQANLEHKIKQDKYFNKFHEKQKEVNQRNIAIHKRNQELERLKDQLDIRSDNEDSDDEFNDLNGPANVGKFRTRKLKKKFEDQCTAIEMINEDITVSIQIVKENKIDQ